MRELKAPPVGGAAERACPRCGDRAIVHARIPRAIHDWEVTFVECLRLRCCGQTFTTTPGGLRPRSRFSDRVVSLARTLVAAGESRRRCSLLLGAAGVPVTPESVRSWCRRLRPSTRARARVTSRPGGRIGLNLRPGLWLVFEAGDPRAVQRLFDREMGVAHVS